MSIIASEKVRLQASESADARSVKTRRAILDALTSLELADENVTVSSIVGRAGISRSVFYRHFAHLDDLAIYLLDQALVMVSRADVDRRENAPRPGVEVVSADVKELVRYLAEHRSLYKAVLSSESGPRAAEEMRRAYITRVNEHLQHFSTPLTETEISTDLTFFAGGLVAVLADWLTQDELTRPTDGELVNLLVRQMPVWMV